MSNETETMICVLCGEKWAVNGTVCDACKGLGEALTAVQKKQCKRCKQVKPLTEFHNDRSSVDGKIKTCKACKREIDHNTHLKKMAAKAKAKKPDVIETILSWLPENGGPVEKPIETPPEPPTISPKSINALLSLLDRLHAEQASLLVAKGNDYSGANRLANFERIAERMGLRDEQVLVVYMAKHFDRILTYAKEGAVSSESVRDSLIDLCNYSALLALMIEARQ